MPDAVNVDQQLEESFFFKGFLAFVYWRYALPSELRNFQIACPERESNPHLRLRRAQLYPLSYRGSNGL